jgi:hypothetical protein
VLGDWSTQRRAWQLRKGEYTVNVGHASDAADLSGHAGLNAKLVR